MSGRDATAGRGALRSVAPEPVGGSSPSPEAPMSGIKVTPEQLQALSGQVARGSGEIEGQLRALSNTVAPLVGGDWAGQAQQRFTALWDEWQRSAQGLKHALDGISQLMNQAGSAYAQAEQSIASTFR
jgi:WXG100 family type VII secretion target